jgi:N-acetylneuraminic acid mutarotase
VGSYTFMAIYTPDSSSSATYNGAAGISPAVTVALPVTTTPVFSVPAGSYSSTQAVTISDATTGATIYYTTNGTTPTTSSPKYTGAITVSSSETLEAIATFNGYTNSAVASAGYLISPLAVGGMLDWTWMGGSSTANHSGVYGTLGTPAAGNIPVSRYGASSWTDGSGNRWLFGGLGYVTNGTGGSIIVDNLNDLWEFNSSTNQWAWMGGSSTAGQLPGVYGTLGTPAAGNIPGSRYGATSWTDSNGHLWLFGGHGYDANRCSGDLNDLWELNTPTNQWTWMGGSSTMICSNNVYGQPGMYGTQGTPAAGNTPGGRENAVSWTDSSGHIWLFGGLGYDANGNYGYLNDLWEFNPSTNQWAWMGGGSSTGLINGVPPETGVYGTLGTPAAGNIPGGRENAVSWTDIGGHLWLFGGYGFNATTTGWLNDLWEFNPSTNQWAWMGGSSTTRQAGVYGTLGTPAAGNIPGARYEASSWTDSSGHLWLFGGGGYDANGNNGYLNDLWEFNPSTNLWEWMGGSSIAGQQVGVYGTLGTPAAGNIPAARYEASSWTDSSGHLWLFGGFGFDGSGNFGVLNDLWEYQLPTTTPTVTVTPSSNSITATQGLTVTVTVSAGSDSRTPSGSVILTGTGGFSTNSTALSGGSATINIPAGLLALGSDTFTATYTPDSSSSSIYNGATGTSSAVTVSPVAPTITFTVPNHTYGDAPFTVAATSNSSGAITYSVVSGPATISGSTVTLTGAGSVVLQASQVAAGNYTAGTQTATVTVAKESQTITFTAPTSPVNYGVAPITLSGSASSGLAITFSVVSGPGTISGSTLTITGVGTVVVAANQAGNANYAAATQVTQSITVNQATQTINFTATTSPVTYGVSPITLVATGGASGNAVTFSVVSGPGTISGSVLTVTGAGTIQIAANQAANTNYSAAVQVTQSIVVNQASQTITFTAPASPVTYGVSPITLVATGGASGNALVFSVVSGPATVSGSTLTITGVGTVVAAANQAGNANYAAATQVTQSIVVNVIGVAATPTFSPVAGSYTAAQTVSISDTTAGATIYYTTNGTTPTTSSTVYSGPIAVSSTETLEAIATATGYSTSAVASAAYTISIPTNPVPAISGISPAFTDAGGAVFTLTVNGSGFIASSTVYWGSSALTTTYVSATQLTAQVPAADIATAGTIGITVQTPAPGGGSSNVWQFEVDSVSSVSTAPTITSTTETVTAGSPASYPVTVPSAVTSVSVTCLNLPTGAVCSYSSTTNTVTITTSSTTPKGTYQIVVVFTETVSGAASGFILLPILLLPLGFMRRKLAARGIWLTACLGLVLLATAALSIGCGGGGGSGSTTPPATHQVTSSGAVSLTIQ